MSYINSSNFDRLEIEINKHIQKHNTVFNRFFNEDKCKYKLDNSLYSNTCFAAYDIYIFKISNVYRMEAIFVPPFRRYHRECRQNQIGLSYGQCNLTLRGLLEHLFSKTRNTRYKCVNKYGELFWE